MTIEMAAAECLFCKVSAGQIPARVVLENEHAIVFDDINPQAPVHCLAIPRRHIESLESVQDEDWAAVQHTLALLQSAARHKGLSPQGYRVVNNMGQHGGQTVYHLHFHLLGGRFLTWPPG